MFQVIRMCNVSWQDEGEKQHDYVLYPFSFISLSLIKPFSPIQVGIIQNATTPNKGVFIYR